MSEEGEQPIEQPVEQPVTQPAIETTVKNVELGSIPNFDCAGDATSLGTRWNKWIRSFKFFLTAKGIENGKQKRALLLHCAGSDVQDIFETLTGTGDDENYDAALKALNEYFKPSVNIPYERHQMRQMGQFPGESIDQFCTRLKQKAKLCDFGDTADDHIRDQIVDRCTSSVLRRKFLEKGKELTLKTLLTAARAYEAADTQAKSMECQQNAASTNNVNIVRKHSKPNGSRSSRQGGQQGSKQGYQGSACYRCGGTNHFAKDKNCPAKGKKCNLCHKYDHFAKCCKSKGAKRKDQRQSKVNLVDEPDMPQGADGYAFTCKTGLFPDDMKVKATTGGVPNITLLIDSGASCNIIDSKLWEYLKANHVKRSSRKADKQLGSSKPLEVLGEF